MIRIQSKFGREGRVLANQSRISHVPMAHLCPCMSVDTLRKRKTKKKYPFALCSPPGSRGERDGELTKKRDVRGETKLSRGNERARDCSGSIKQIDLMIHGRSAYDLAYFSLLIAFFSTPRLGSQPKETKKKETQPGVRGVREREG